MEITVTNLLDAFKALEDVDIDDSAALQALREGRSFDVRSPQAMEEAEEFIKPVKKEVTLEVIDPDADSIEHLKHNEDYVGQLILQCDVCKSKMFLDAEKLVPAEDDDNLYNKDMECPHCHKEGYGFSLIGQVGQVPEEEEPEVTLDNDSLTAEEGEPTFEAEPEEEVPAEEEPEAAEEPEPEIPEGEEDTLIDEEPDGMEAAAEDDTADMEEPALGTEYEEVIEYDDTEEKPEEEAAEEEEENSDAELTAVPDEEEEEKKKRESLTEDVAVEIPTVENLFNRILEPEKITTITIWAVNDEAEQKAFSGTFEEMPEDIKNVEINSFNTDGGKFIINTDITADAVEGDTVADVLRWFDDDFDVDVILWDAEQGELLSGTRDTILSDYKDLPCTFISAPERINIYSDNLELKEDFKGSCEDVLDLSKPEDQLISDIINCCGYSEGRICIEGTPEYWLADSIRRKEDLAVIFNSYVSRCGEKISREFKEITGYTDALDEALITEREAASTPVDKDTAIEAAKKALADSRAYAVIYGYQKNGKFYGFKDVIVCPNEDAYNDKAEIVDLRYRPTGAIATLFHSTVQESVVVNSRGELKKLIMECRNNKQPYTVRSLGNSKYELIKESPAPFAQVITEAVEEAEPEEVEVAEDETVIEAPAEETEVQEPEPNVFDQVLRVANDMAEAIKARYDLETDIIAVFGDLLKDFGVVEEVLPVELEENETIGGALMRVYGDVINAIEAEKAASILETLTNEAFSREAIEATVNDEAFFEAIKAGEIPGVVFEEKVEAEEAPAEEPASEEAEPEQVEESLEEPAAVSDEVVEVGEIDESEELTEGDVGDVQADEVIEEPEQIEEPEEEMFDIDSFEDFINKHYDNTVEETVIFECDKASVNEENEIILDGTLYLEEDKTDKIEFVLKPILTEGFKKSYSVTNSLFEDVLTYNIK